MRIGFYSCVGAAILSLGLTSGAWAQEQPAAGAPPPGQTQAAPAQDASPSQPQSADQTQTPDQTQAPAQGQQDQNAASGMSGEMPPPPIDARRGPNPKKQAKQLAMKLGLTPDQESDAELVFANRAQRIRKARMDASLAAPDRKAVMRQINRDALHRINALLTPEQRQAYRQLRKEERAKRMERREQQQQQQQPTAVPDSAPNSAPAGQNPE